MTSTMQAILFESYDGPEALRMAEVAVPEPGPGEARVRMVATGLNNSDLQTTRGGYGRPPLPHIPGQEGAGIVDAVGEGVTAFRPGDRVAGRIRKSLAQYAVAATTELITVPEGLDLVEAASLPVSYLTAGMGIIHKARLEAGEWLLVNPGSGAVGAAAIRLGRMLDAQVIACTSSPSKFPALERYGAQHLIDASRQDVAETARQITGGRGVDVAVDGAGAVTLAQCIDAAANNARIVTYGTTTGNLMELSLGKMLLRNLNLHGYAIWSNVDYQATLATLGTVIMPAVATGRLGSIVDLVVDFGEARRAFEAMAARQLSGKAVVRIV